MRKFLVPLLVAGALAFTASAAMATANYEKGSFTEEHSDFKGSPGDHYKVTDITEVGGHGKGVGGFQLSSAILKSLAAFDFEGDDSFGYVTGKNPFTDGWAGAGSLGETDWAMPAPLYTIPCPEWVASGPDGAKLGTCPANANATDPQTEDPDATWDGVILDDLYQAVGQDDSSFSTFDEDGDTWAVRNVRFLDQTLDILFYNGKRGQISGVSTSKGTASRADDEILKTSTWGSIETARHLNIDQTLDQDVADYLIEYEGTTVNLGNLYDITNSKTHEIMGIYGKLTQLYQLGGAELTNAGVVALVSSSLGINANSVSVINPYGGTEGCASWGGNNAGGVANGYPDGDCRVVLLDSTEEIDGFGWVEMLEDPNGDGNKDDMVGKYSAHLIDQWVVSDMYDWHPYNGTEDGLNDKYRGRGVMQKYSSWFRDGSPKDFTYGYDYPGGHGAIDKDVTGTNKNINGYLHEP